MDSHRRLTNKEWADLLDWLLPKRSYGASRGAYDAMLSPHRLAESILARNNAPRLTEFLDPRIVESLKTFSSDSPVSFRLNLQRLIEKRIASQEQHER